ncbi:unnamed protein product [Hermetia illucens]|uniref:Uncharacterized protein n=1 Tax=Hermetia illucens TaxID=343691 RepID=A0A7R8UCE0_HERIL|nr:uncharacterized protein LOC119661117 [Hermetia illucens]CAD7078208.1 unnamed protein product [Hermetia illucens]
MSLWQIAITGLIVISMIYIIYYYCNASTCSASRRRRSRRCNRHDGAEDGERRPSIYTVQVPIENPSPNARLDLNGLSDLPPSYDEVIKQNSNYLQLDPKSNTTDVT